MCLGIPGRIESIAPGGDLRMGRLSFGGIVKEVCLEYVPEAAVGDFVIVHVGFAISRVSPDEAARVFEYLDQIGQLDEIARLDETGGSPS